MEPWQQWATAAVTFLTGLAAIWGTLRAIRRKDREEERQEEQAQNTLDRESDALAIRQCWEFAKKREQYYDKELKERESRIAEMERSKQELRKELHDVRNQWAEEQLRRVRLEEELKWTKAELTVTRAELDQARGRPFESGGHDS